MEQEASRTEPSNDEFSSSLSFGSSRALETLSSMPHGSPYQRRPDMLTCASRKRGPWMFCGHRLTIQLRGRHAVASWPLEVRRGVAAVLVRLISWALYPSSRRPVDRVAFCDGKLPGWSARWHCSCGLSCGLSSRRLVGWWIVWPSATGNCQGGAHGRTVVHDMVRLTGAPCSSVTM